MSPAVPSTLSAAAELASARSTLAGWAERALALVRSLGPYAAIELLLPGGSVLALLLWLYRRRQRILAERMASVKLTLTLEEQTP
jgi:hypothetical protein